MVNVAYQLYCSRNFPTLHDACDMLAATGYKQVEGYGGLFDDLNGLRTALDQNGLHMASTHVGLDMLEDDPARALSIAKDLRIEKMFVPYLDESERPSDAAGWRAFGQRLAEAGKPIKDAGISFGWHNHDFEFFKLASGEMPMDLIAEAEIDLELDLGWVLRAGYDPVDWITKYGSQIKAVHVKDIAPEGECTDEDGWSDVGHGTVDWAPIHRALLDLDIDHYVIEHDNPSDHKRFAQRSFATVSNF